MALFFIIFLTVYTSINYYVFIRGWQVISAYPVLKPIYAVLFIVVAYGYVLAKILYKYLSPLTYDILLGVGAIWFAFLAYFILSLLLIDIVRLLNGWFHFLPDYISNNYEFAKKITAIVVIALVGLIVFLGNLNKRDIEIRSLEITVPKGEGKLDELNIVMASDIHLSPIDGERLLETIVDKMNSLNPDIILLAGDIVDDKARVLDERGIGESFKKLKSKYGVYSINGNHEFINGVDSCVRYAEKFGIKFLRDSYTLIDSCFYLIGREDSSMPQFIGRQRKSLEEIVSDLPNNYPKILLDHTPFKLEQAQQNKMDLQLSGHTHHGQIWPANLITKMIYELSWGYKKKGNTHYYVSSGAGTWGPPVRTGSSSEIVNIKIMFE
ncbi:MAG: metallophosphoesterase [Ignavibacteriaceae bacterium]|nr:metallophosphoesterase [Ignavibacterium sp.]MCC6256264.1 metallophosphoesterase [Ignavibacteriaceae bacterium]HRN25942.1 metallophosphoesterase [Ignavibacteriaceae bacterium]HRP91665.1 metallophosphoesterase [Ignavibacteriaceae bacterium]HRQ53559.1 metallophosphoesterase [Ignavibacteriaceae bacterium]